MQILVILHLVSFCKEKYYQENSYNVILVKFNRDKLFWYSNFIVLFKNSKLSMEKKENVENINFQFQHLDYFKSTNILYW